MKQKRFLVFILLFQLILFFGFSAEAAGKHLLTILHTNDHHGHFWSNENGDGGMPVEATLVREIQEEVKKNGGDVLLLSAGDVNTGYPASDMADGKPDFMGMKYMGYAAMTIGNHEFDKGLDSIKRQEGWAGFPFLSANIFYKNSKKGPFKQYIIKKLAGLKIAILGLTLDDLPIKTSKFPSDKLDIRSSIDTAKAIVPELRKESDFLIALTHMGYYAPGKLGDNAPGDLELAQSAPEIDVIVGGHTHTALFKPVIEGKTIIVQAESNEKYLGRLDLEITDNEKKIKQYRLIPIDMKEASPGTLTTPPDQPDQKLISVLKPYHDKTAKLMAEQVVNSLEKWESDRKEMRRGENNIGNLLSAILKKSTDADIGVINSGSIRASLPKGTVNYGQILMMQPFANTYVTVKFTGKELKDYLEAIAKIPPDTAAYPQISGVRFTFNSQKSEISDLIIETKHGLKPLDETKTYTLATNNFCANGGDGYPVINNHPSFKNTKIIDAEAIRAFLKEKKTIDPKDYKPTGYFKTVEDIVGAEIFHFKILGRKYA